MISWSVPVRFLVYWRIPWLLQIILKIVIVIISKPLPSSFKSGVWVVKSNFFCQRHFLQHKRQLPSCTCIQYTSNHHQSVYWKIFLVLLVGDHYIKFFVIIITIYSFICMSALSLANINQPLCLISSSSTILSPCMKHGYLHINIHLYAIILLVTSQLHMP